MMNYYYKVKDSYKALFEEKEMQWIKEGFKLKSKFN